MPPPRRTNALPLSWSGQILTFPLYEGVHLHSTANSFYPLDLFYDAFNDSAGKRITAFNQYILLISYVTYVSLIFYDLNNRLAIKINEIANDA